MFVVSRRKIIENYQIFLKTNNLKKHQFNKTKLKKIIKTDFPKIIIDRIYQENNYIPLRKYQNEKTFIIGSGNNKNYFAYTLNLKINKNPSIIGYFKEFSIIPNESFKMIIIENISLIKDYDLFLKECLRILSEGGVVKKREEGKIIDFFKKENGIIIFNKCL